MLIKVTKGGRLPIRKVEESISPLEKFCIMAEQNLRRQTTGIVTGHKALHPAVSNLRWGEGGV